MRTAPGRPGTAPLTATRHRSIRQPRRSAPAARARRVCPSWCGPGPVPRHLNVDRPDLGQHRLWATTTSTLWWTTTPGWPTARAWRGSPPASACPPRRRTGCWPATAARRWRTWTAPAAGGSAATSAGRRVRREGLSTVGQISGTAATPGGSNGIALASASGRWILAATAIGSGMAFLDGTVVNVALPTIGGQLGADIGGLQWILNGYLLTLAALILLSGSLGDRYGRRRVFQIGVLWFALASAACTVAPDLRILVIARVVQGIGGALMTPGSLAIIESTIRRGDRPKPSASGLGLRASRRRSDHSSVAGWLTWPRGG